MSHTLTVAVLMSILPQGDARVRDQDVDLAAERLLNLREHAVDLGTAGNITLERLADDAELLGDLVGNRSAVLGSVGDREVGSA
jgi:uncharacterized protein (UPF0264 family)